jgi:hypothetical protein
MFSAINIRDISASASALENPVESLRPTLKMSTVSTERAMDLFFSDIGINPVNESSSLCQNLY